jgi:type VI secretion system VasD/TssJ family lipoprotein
MKRPLGSVVVGCCLLVISLALAAGCGGANKELRCRSPRSLKYVVTASDRTNPDDQGQALATVVRVYQLKGLSRLENADFEDIWLKGEETLADDLVKVEEMTLFPKDEQAHTIDVAEGVSYLVAVALFRKPAGVSWRAVYELPLQSCSGGKATGKALAHFVIEDYRIEALEETPASGVPSLPGVTK